MWLDLELSGTRPKPLVFAATATIDEHRALLHGRDVENESHSILINLNRKVNLRSLIINLFSNIFSCGQSLISM